MKNSPFIFFVLMALMALTGNIKAQDFNWEIISSTVDCRDAVIENDTVWVATTGGLVKFKKDGTWLKTYTAKEGLSQTDCYYIEKDSHGNKYIGTGRFVSKFDGKNFTTLGEESLKIHGISALKVLANDNLVFCSVDGVSIDYVIGKYDGSQVTTFPNKITPSLMYGIIPKFDSSGKLWVVNSAGKLCTFDGTSIVDMTKNLNPDNGLAFYYGAKINFDKNDVPYLVLRDKSILKLNGEQWDAITPKGSFLTFDQQTNNMVIVRNDSIFYYDATIKVANKLKLNYPYPEWSQYMQVTYNNVVDNGSFSWILSSAGCLKSDRTTITKQIPASVAPGQIKGLAIETNGTIWACSDQAISYLVGNQWHIVPFSETGNAFGNATWVSIDNDNRKWFGTMEGLLCYDNQTWKKINSSNTPSLQTESFTCSYSSGSNTWFGTMTNGVYLLNGTTWTNFSTTNGLPSTYVYSICSDASGKLWVATDKGVATYSNSTWTKINDLKTYLVFADSKGRIWTGHDGYVQYLDGMNWKTINDYLTLKSTTFRIGFGDVKFLSAKEDASGKVWLGYGMMMFGGYFYFDETNMIDPDQANITYVQAPIQSIILDKQNRLWLGAANITVIDQMLVGIEDQPSVWQHTKVYPTICTDVLNIQSNVLDKKMITVFDNSGRKIYSSIFEGTTFQVQTSNYTKGLYLINIRNNQSSETYKFIKE